MKYAYIIQELKESGDPNVVAFLKDAAKIKRLSRKERAYCLEHRSLPGTVKKLVEEFIPYAIFVAYSNSHKTRILSVLDLINEGILGAYKAFERNSKDEPLTRRIVNSQIKNNIRYAVLREYNLAYSDIELEDVVIDNLKIYI